MKYKGKLIASDISTSRLKMCYEDSERHKINWIKWCVKDAEREQLRKLILELYDYLTIQEYNQVSSMLYKGIKEYLVLKQQKLN